MYFVAREKKRCVLTCVACEIPSKQTERAKRAMAHDNNNNHHNINDDDDDYADDVDVLTNDVLNVPLSQFNGTSWLVV